MMNLFKLIKKQLQSQLALSNFALFGPVSDEMILSLFAQHTGQ
jgi:hypothetical protein